MLDSVRAHVQGVSNMKELCKFTSANLTDKIITNIYYTDESEKICNAIDGIYIKPYHEYID